MRDLSMITLFGFVQGINIVQQRDYNVLFMKLRFIQSQFMHPTFQLLHLIWVYDLGKSNMYFNAYLRQQF